MKLFPPLLLFSSVLHAQRHTDSLRMFIAAQIKAYKIPALAIGVIKGDSILLEEGFGTLSTTDTTATTGQTLFPIMSRSKAFTATSLAILVDDDKLKWTDKVTRLVPYFKLSDSNITKQLNITDILSHRSGLQSFEGDLLWYRTHYSPSETIRRISYSPVRNTFRKEYGYQNIMYFLAGTVLESVTKTRWSEFIEERIFTPLNMTHTYAGYDPSWHEKLALPHLANSPGTAMATDNFAPAGGIYSTVDDMIKWMRLWVRKGEGLISKNSFKEMPLPKFISTKKRRSGMD